MILGIESSCDESAIALLHKNGNVMGEWIHSQIANHADYGGVVPDVAVREHMEKFFPLLDQAKHARELSDVVDLIAVTRGPGLIGCLGVGLTVGKTLGNLWGVPVVGVNHLRGHAFSPFMHLGSSLEQWAEYLPHLGLLVSGGNTILFEVSKDIQITVLGRTMDDAVGEALDKGAKLLGLSYPGGAQMEKFAQDGDPGAFKFPVYQSSRNDLSFSFSGLKTSMLYTLQKMNETEVKQNFADLCASYQQAAVVQLVRQTQAALKQGTYNSLGLSGGVANNQKLRDRFHALAEDLGFPLLAAQKKHTGDNAAMIAFAALADPAGTWSDFDGSLNVSPGLKMDDHPSSIP